MRSGAATLGELALAATARRRKMIEARRTYFYANGTLPHCPTAIEMNRPGGPGRGMAVRKTRRRSRQAAKPSRCGVRALPDCLHDVREDGAPLGAHRGRGESRLDARVSCADDGADRSHDGSK